MRAQAALGADPTPTPTDRHADAHPDADADPDADRPRRRRLPTPTPTPGPIVLGDTVTFFGRGYGHGVGMSQYGARGRALAGQSSTTILAHYYRGATLGTVPTTTRIRVRILYGWTANAERPAHRLRPARPVDDRRDRRRSFPADAVLRVIPKTVTTSTGPPTTWPIRVTSATGVVLYSGPKAEQPRRSRRRPAPPGSSCGRSPSRYDQFRGILRIRTSSTKPTVTVVNDLPLETYLRGVVGVEMSSAWPTAALEAQAIASRSYAARRLRPGVSYYDVPDDSSSQVYHGALGEHATTNVIVKATAGVVLRSGSSIANTLYHSAGGGATENNENVYVSATGAKVAGAVSYLRGSMDRDATGRPYDAASPYATWATATYTRAQLSAWFAADSRTNVGTLTAIDLRNRGVSGRLISVTLIGSAGTKRVSGDVFRSIFNAGRPSTDPMLRSTLFATAPIP